MELFLCAPGRALRRVRDFSPEWLFAVHCGTGQSQEPADFQSADRCSNPTALELFTGQDRCVAREDVTARRAAARVGRRTDVQARARAGHRAVSDLCLSLDADFPAHPRRLAAAGRLSASGCFVAFSTE